MPDAPEILTNPLMLSALVPAIPPDTVKAEPFAPDPFTVHVCSAPRITGAEMVTLPALLPTNTPSAEALGVIVRIPVTLAGVNPPATVTEVMPFGSLLKTRSLTV